MDVVLAELGKIRSIHPANVDATVGIGRMAIGTGFFRAHRMAFVAIEAAQSNMHTAWRFVVSRADLPVDLRGVALITDAHTVVVGERYRGAGIVDSRMWQLLTREKLGFSPIEEPETSWGGPGDSGFIRIRQLGNRVLIGMDLVAG